VDELILPRWPGDRWQERALQRGLNVGVHSGIDAAIYERIYAEDLAVMRGTPRSRFAQLGRTFSDAVAGIARLPIPLNPSDWLPGSRLPSPPGTRLPDPLDPTGGWGQPTTKPFLPLLGQLAEYAIQYTPTFIKGVDPISYLLMTPTKIAPDPPMRDELADQMEAARQRRRQPSTPRPDQPTLPGLDGVEPTPIPDDVTIQGRAGGVVMADVAKRDPLAGPTLARVTLSPAPEVL
jgi:hypothetical protein